MVSRERVVFRHVRIPVLRGRAIAVHDIEGSRPVVVINATLARLYWPDENPIGQLLNDLLDDPPRGIVGVVGTWPRTATSQSAAAGAVARAQLPHRMDMMILTCWWRRSYARPTPGGNHPSMRTALREIDPTLLISSVRTVKMRR
jgi:hypothetical protein